MERDKHAPQAAEILSHLPEYNLFSQQKTIFGIG